MNGIIIFRRAKTCCPLRDGIVRSLDVRTCVCGRLLGIGINFLPSRSQMFASFISEIIICARAGPH